MFSFTNHESVYQTQLNSNPRFAHCGFEKNVRTTEKNGRVIDAVSGMFSRCENAVVYCSFMGKSGVLNIVTSYIAIAALEFHVIVGRRARVVKGMD